jgi:WXG100 family type VII secretion target
MPQEGFIKYDYNTIDEGIGQIMQVNKEIDHLIEELSNHTGHALDNWTGPAAANYNELAGRIAGNFTDMNSIVQSLAVELRERAADMMQQDSRSAKSRFSA